MNKFFPHLSISRYLPLAPFLAEPSQHKETDKKKYLFVKDDMLTDLFVFSGVIRFMVEKGYDIWVVVDKQYASIAEYWIAKDRVIPVDKVLYDSNVLYRYTFLNSLRGIGFHYAVGSISHSSICDDIVAKSGAIHRYGYQRRKTLRERWKLTGTDSVVDGVAEKIHPNLYRPSVEIEAYYLSQLLNQPVIADDIKSFMPKDNSSYDKTLVPQEPYILYLIDTHSKRQSYPIKTLLTLLYAYADRCNMKVVVIGERAIKIPVEYNKRIVNYSGNDDLKKILGLIYCAKGVLGSDAGLTHIATVIGSPTVIISGGGLSGKVNISNENTKQLAVAMDCFGCGWRCHKVTRIRKFPCVLVKSHEIEKSIDDIMVCNG